MNEGTKGDETMPVLQTEGLRKDFQSGHGVVSVLRGIDLTLQKGEMVGIMGASGVGKSTLLQILGGLDRPSGGRVVCGGSDIYALNKVTLARLRNRTIGFVFQFHHLLAEFTALENVMMPALISGAVKTESRGRATDLLQKVGLSDRLHHKPGKLSGGEQQRVAVARALVNKPDVILADEPTGNLDERTGEEIYELLGRINQELRTSFLVATHNDRLARQMGRVVRISEGRLET